MTKLSSLTQGLRRPTTAGAQVKASLRTIAAALSDYTRAIDLDPQNPKPYYGSAYSKILLGKTEAGCKDAKRSFDMGYTQAEQLLTQYCQ